MDRCPWVGDDAIYRRYHDEEWGVPETDGRALYEKLVLDGFQAGLSWLTILRKRAAFRTAFDGFVPERVARWGEREVARALGDAGIVRHRGKIEAAVGNARAWLEIEAAGGFAAFLWAYVDGAPVQTRYARQADVPPRTALSERISKDLRTRGFRFVGPTVVHAFMEACGFFNNHLVTCHRHDVVARMGHAVRL